MQIEDLTPYAVGHLNRRGLAPTLRPKEDVRMVFVHHSGALSKLGPRSGALASLRYTMSNLAWKMPAYHFWIPVEGPTILQFAPLEWRCYHTGGEANGSGVGVCVQGNKNTQQLTDFQEQALCQLLPDLARRLGYDPDAPASPAWLSWHSEADLYGGKRKAACPGRHTVNFLRRTFRGAIA